MCAAACLCIFGLVMENNTIRAYKGFEPDLTCRGFQYEVGKEYELEGPIDMYSRGFHACRQAADVFKFYPPYKANGLTRYCIVEISGDIEEDDDKVCGSHIKILEEISLKDMIREATDPERIWGNYKSRRDMVAASIGSQTIAANTGIRSIAANTGSQSIAINTGLHSVAANRGWGSVAANTGNQSVAINAARKSVAINTGDSSDATSLGWGSVAIETGQSSWALAKGLHSVALSTGTWSKARVTESNSIAIVTGKDGCACGVLGSWLVLTELGWRGAEILDIRAVKVDGKEILPGTWYALINGKVVRACNDN